MKLIGVYFSRFDLQLQVGQTGAAALPNLFSHCCNRMVESRMCSLSQTPPKRWRQYLFALCLLLSFSYIVSKKKGATRITFETLQKISFVKLSTLGCFVYMNSATWWPSSLIQQYLGWSYIESFCPHFNPFRPGVNKLMREKMAKIGMGSIEGSRVWF